ncbi:MAG TPA: hypothetical protein VER11_16375 [Polyangiaceae bacterium]|nr:hypothetical protein [Polyangiaceae bacterium]
MVQAYRVAAWGVALAGTMLLGACLGTAPPLTPIQGTVELPAQARVVLRGVDGDILKFHVFNLSDKFLLVARDEIALSCSKGTRHRKPGGSESYYTIPPGGEHAVNVRFSFAELAVGETVSVVFDRALLRDGNPLPEHIPPISLRVEKRPEPRPVM